MNRIEHICLMAEYNEQMNAQLYEAAKGLPDEELNANRKAFFGSILGTLNHLIAGDTIWLKRFSTHPSNYSAIAVMDFILSYSNMQNAAAKKNVYSLVIHFFNNQTHHRGQATTLLSQAGADVGVTDMLLLIPDEVVVQHIMPTDAGAVMAELGRSTDSILIQFS